MYICVFVCVCVGIFWWICWRKGEIKEIKEQNNNESKPKIIISLCRRKWGWRRLQQRWKRRFEGQSRPVAHTEAVGPPASSSSFTKYSSGPHTTASPPILLLTWRISSIKELSKPLTMSPTGLQLFGSLPSSALTSPMPISAVTAPSLSPPSSAWLWVVWSYYNLHSQFLLFLLLGLNYFYYIENNFKYSKKKKKKKLIWFLVFESKYLSTTILFLYFVIHFLSML